jgi:hypothetical protein
MTNQRKKFDEIGTILGVKSLEDWYSIPTRKVIAIKGSSGLLRIYNNSLSEALRTIYADHDWKSYLFNVTRHDLHEDWTQVENFVKDAEKRLRIKCNDDWLRVSQETLWRLGGGQLIAKNGGLVEVRLSSF